MGKDHKLKKYKDLTYVWSPSKNDLCTVSLWIRVGAVNETSMDAGISHLLEHLLFRGSKNPEFDSNEKIFEAYDKIGAIHNGETEKDYTVYYATSLDKHFERMLEIITAFVLNPKLDKKDLEMEKSIVLREVESMREDPKKVAIECLEKKLFENCTLENNIGGDKKSITGITYKSIVDFYKSYYIPENMVLSVCGSSEKNVRKGIEKYFNNFKSTTNPPPIITDKPDSICPLNGKSYVKYLNEDMNESHTVILVGFTWDPQKIVSGKVFQTLIAGLTSSRLFIRLRTKCGLVYGVKSKVCRFMNGGYILVSTVTKNENIEKVCNVIDDELNQLCRGDLSQEELNTVKEKIINASSIKILNTVAKSFYYGKEILYWGKVCDYDDYLKEIKNISLSQLKKEFSTLAKHKKVRVIVK